MRKKQQIIDIIIVPELFCMQYPTFSLLWSIQVFAEGSGERQGEG